MSEQIWWFIARATGIVAWGFLTASVVWGAVLASDLFKRWRRPAWLLDLHRWLGALTLAFVALHLVALWADAYIEFTPIDFAVPYASEWKPGAVAWGVVATWLLAAVQLTSLAKRRIPRTAWRAVHLTSYLAFWATSLHGTFAGTDATQPVYVVGTTLALLSVAFAATYRILTRRVRTPAPSAA